MEIHLSVPKRGKSPNFKPRCVVATWYGGRPRPRQHCVRWRPRSRCPKKTGAQHSPILGHVYSGQRVGWIKMILGTEVGLGPGHIMLDGDPAPLPKEGTAPKCLAHACCGQTTEWIKMPLGIEVGLGPGDAVLDGDPASSPKRAQPPIFGTCLL